MKVVYTQEAVRDLVDAYEYLIGRGELRAAQRIDTTIERLVERLSAGPAGKSSGSRIAIS